MSTAKTSAGKLDMHIREGWRRTLVRLVLGPDLIREFERWPETLEALRRELDDLAADLKALREKVEQPSGPPAELGPVLEWISGAEAHLASLQADHERVRTLQQQHAAQLDRIIERTAFLESRTGDLERADTEIAVAIAKARLSDVER